MILGSGGSLDSATALQTLSIIITSSSAVGGLLVVAAVFFMGQMMKLSDSYSWMREYGVLRRLYLGVWSFYTLWTFFTFFVPFAYAVSIIMNGSSLVIQIEGGSASISPQHAAEVQSLLDKFQGFLSFIVIMIPSMFLFAAGFPPLADWVATRGVSRQSIESNGAFFLVEALAYLKASPKEAPCDGDVPRWIAEQLKEGNDSGFRRHIDARASVLMAQMDKGKFEQVQWIGVIVALTLLLFMLLLTFLL